MALSELEQAKAIAARANRVLVTFPREHALEATGSALALARVLEGLGKQVDVVSSGFELPGSLRFLPGATRVSDHVANLQKFVITVNLAQAELQDLSYSIDGGKLAIFLTPKQGSFTSQDIGTKAADFSYDLVITLDTPDLVSLGELAQSNTEFFYATPILNLDCSPANEHFGTVNLVNLNAPSTADVAFELLEALTPNPWDADTATCLYTSLSAATRSFTTPRVTPDTLSRAARLVSLGARREEVVEHLYRTKQLTTLKLWGRALARLKSDSARRLVWSLIQPDDFLKSGAAELALAGVVDELILSAPEAGTVLLLAESTAGTTTAYVHAGPGRSALDLLKPFSPKGSRSRARATLSSTSVLEAEQKVVTYLKELLPQLDAS